MTSDEVEYDVSWAYKSSSIIVFKRYNWFVKWTQDKTIKLFSVPWTLGVYQVLQSCNFPDLYTCINISWPCARCFENISIYLYIGPVFDVRMLFSHELHIVWPCFRYQVIIIYIISDITRRVIHVDQELTLAEHLISPPVFYGVCVARSLVFYVMYYDILSFFFWPLSSLTSSIYDFWLPLWYLRTFLMRDT